MPKSSFSIVWSKRSERDLLDIWNYYAGTAGLQTADEIVRKLIGATNPLGNFPRFGWGRDEIRLGLRSIVCAPFVVFYQLGDGEVRVIRVVDGRRDIEELLAEDQDNSN